MTTQTSSRAYFLLAILVLVWGANWPTMKIGLQYISPLWFCVARFIIGSLGMFLLLLLTKKFRLPSRHDLPILLSVSVFQITIFICLINLALLHVNVGQSAILSYSTPIWLAPFAVLIFKEQMSHLKFLGLLLGFIGILVLFNPLHHDWSNHQVLIGNLELIIAALCSAVVILHIRFAKWQGSPLTLLPWQLLIAAVLTSIIAVLVEPHPIIHWNNTLIVILLYTGLAATAFGYWCMVTISKALPAITTSLGLLGVPLLGLLFATFFLHEPFTWSLGISIVLFIVGMAMVNIADVGMMRRKKIQIALSHVE